MINNYAFLIPAGGIGSRLRPLTNEYPKPFLPIYFEKEKIVRMIDLPLKFCKENNINAYVILDYKHEKLEYIRNSNVTIYYTHEENLFKVLLHCLKKIKETNVKCYSVFAPDFVIEEDIIKNMMELFDSSIDLVALCTYKDAYPNITINYNEKSEYKINDLTFHISTVDFGIKSLENMIKNNTKNLWNCTELKPDSKLLVTDIEHIDMGTSNEYYEILRKMNKIDHTGNIVFPGAEINENSKNVVALPNSYSKDIVLENCIIPESKVVESIKDVLIIDNISSKKFIKNKKWV